MVSNLRSIPVLCITKKYRLATFLSITSWQNITRNFDTKYLHEPFLFSFFLGGVPLSYQQVRGRISNLSREKEEDKGRRDINKKKMEEEERRTIGNWGKKDTQRGERKKEEECPQIP